MKLQPRACPVCGFRGRAPVVLQANYNESTLDEFAFASRKVPEFMRFRMVCCPTCDLLYADPAPDLGWVREAYRRAAFDTAEESRHAARTYAHQLVELASQLPDREGVLDIGAGDGAFLEQLLNAGFSEVAGEEPSCAPVAQARPAIRRLIHNGFFAPERYASRSLALVTCFQTLEHLDDPGDLCGSAYKLLKPGGVFWAVAHNYRSLPARLLGARSPIYDIEHLQLYSPRSLRFMLQRAGFERIEVGPIRNAFPFAYWVKLLPMRAGPKKVLQRALASVGLGSLVIPLWAGNMQVIAYKRGT